MTAPGPAGSPPHAVPPGHGGVPADSPHGVAAPPPGPGVAPPFAAPPTEGRTVRMWIGLGVAALAVVLCCGGGVAALIGLAVAGTQAINEQARAVVGDYLDAVSHDKYDKAYSLLCDDAQKRESPREFQQRVTAEPEIASYKVHEATVNTQVTVPVDVTYDGGSRDNLRFFLAQDGRSGALEVCGVN
jgi:hypothetical protein